MVTNMKLALQLCLLDIIQLVLFKVVKILKGGHHSQISTYLINIS